MAYISSNANRFYTALETAYGTVGAITSSNRIPAVKLSVRHELEVTGRKDKTGSRTFPGLPAGGRRRTNFQLQTYLTSWNTQNGDPAYGPLVEACLGGSPLRFAGGTASVSNGATLTFTAPHGL